MDHVIACLSDSLSPLPPVMVMATERNWGTCRRICHFSALVFLGSATFGEVIKHVFLVVVYGCLTQWKKTFELSENFVTNLVNMTGRN